MADPLERSQQITVNGLATPLFEQYWYDVTLLAPPQPNLLLELAIMDELGRATPYFEEIWNLVAVALNRPTLDLNSILVDSEGRSTEVFEEYWKVLIT